MTTSKSTRNTGPDPADGFDRLIDRLDGLVDRIERLLPAPAPPPDWKESIAFRWRKRDGRGRLAAVAHPHRIRLSDLQGIDRQKTLVERNTRQFVAGRPANNVLLTGARGTGKSSLIKALLNRFHREGLRLIEVDKQDLVDLPDIIDLVAGRPERFVVFCDDLSFEASEAGYKSLKVALDPRTKVNVISAAESPSSNSRTSDSGSKLMDPELSDDQSIDIEPPTL